MAFYVDSKKQEKITKRETKEEKKEKRKKEISKRKTKQTCAQGAGRVLRTRLLFAGTISRMICPADGPTKGRHKKTRRKPRRQEEGRDKELTTNKNEQSYVQLVGQGPHNRHKDDRDRRSKEKIWTWLCDSCPLRSPAAESVRLDIYCS